MTDSRTMFREADSITAPDLWAEIEVRATERDRPAPPWSRPSTVSQRVPTMLAAVVAAALALALVVWTLRPATDAPRPGAPEPWSIVDRIQILGASSSAVGSDGALWVSTVRGLVRLDPATDVVTDPIGVGGPLASELDGTLWVNTDHGVVRIDARTGATSEPIAVKDAADAAFAAGFGSAWVGEYKGDVIRRVDADGGVVHIDVPGWPVEIATTGDAVWSITLDGTVDRIDPATDSVTEERDLGASVGGDVHAFGIAVDGSNAYATLCVDGTLDAFGTLRECSWSIVRLDARTLDVLGTFPLGDSTEMPTTDGLNISFADARTVLAHDGDIWVATDDYRFTGSGNPYVVGAGERGTIHDPRILRIDSTTGRVVQTLALDGAPVVDATESPGTVWLVQIGGGVIRLQPQPSASSTP